MAITRPANLQMPFANAGAKREIPVDSQIGIDSGAASYTDGFPPLTRTPIAAGGIPPKGVDVNGILFEVSSHTVFQNAGGQYRFDAALATAIGGYPKGSVLQADTGFYSCVSLVDNNAVDFNTDPAAIGVSWMLYSSRPYTFAEADALTANIGPITVIGMDGIWEWSTSAYFTGYRHPRCGHWEDGWTPTPLAFQIEAHGGVWSEADPKEKRVIARFRESGLVVPIGSWIAGQGKIADLGGGTWKAVDYQNMHKRAAGTDADTANVRAMGSKQNDALQNITGFFDVRALAEGSGVIEGIGQGSLSGALAGGEPSRRLDASLSPAANLSAQRIRFDASRVARTSVETRSVTSATGSYVHC